jgi:hypothetical protein
LTALTAFYDDVLAECPGVPRALALHHIRRAVIEFHQCAQALRKTSAALDVTGAASGATFTMPSSELPTGHMLVGVTAAWWNRNELELVSPTDIAARIGADWMTQAGTPQFVTQTDDDTIRLVPHPSDDADAALIVEFVYGPTDAVTSMDTALFNRWRDKVAAGALWRLKRMAAKPWSDPVGAREYRDIFEKAKSSMSIGRIRGVMGAPLVTKPHAF